MTIPCEHTRTIIETTGGYHFDGEPWDSLSECVICADCGQVLDPGELPDLTPAELAEQLATTEPQEYPIEFHNHILAN